MCNSFISIRPKRTKISLSRLDILGELVVELRKHNDRLGSIEQKQIEMDSKLDKIQEFLGITELKEIAFPEECNYYA